METLNNQLIKLGVREGDTVIGDSWLARVIMNEFGLGLSLKSSHDPQALCDGSFPAIPTLRVWKKRQEAPIAGPFKYESTLPEVLGTDNDMPLECSDD